MEGISAVITTYNREEDCRRAVKSVLNQSTSLDVEIIVVEDGSEEEYDAEWFTSKGCIYLKIENSGMCAARNLGFGRATYPWIALLDDDDWWRPNHLQVLSGEIQNAGEEVVMVYTQGTDFFGDGRFVDRPFKQPEVGQSDLDFIFDNGRLTSATCYRKSAVLASPFTGKDRFSEDIWHSGRLLNGGRSIPIHKSTVMINHTTMGATRGANKRTYLAAVTAYSQMKLDSDFQSVRGSVFAEKLAWWYYFGLRHVSQELDWKQWFRAVRGLLKYNSVSVRYPSKSIRRAASNARLIACALRQRLFAR